MFAEVLAIQGGKPVRKEYLSYAKPWYGREEEKQVIESLRSGWITTGPKVVKFEEEFRKFTGAKEAVAVNSCTAALHISLLSAGIGPGDEVITTPFTFCATANAVLYTGAKPVLADIDPVTMNISVAEIKKKINRRTKAVIPVHYSGLPCDMDEINALAKRHNLFVFEDAAHAAGAKYRGKMIGNTGDASSFSFHAVKNLTTAEGGMLTTNNRKLAERARVFRLHGIPKDAWKRYAAGGSWYYEMTELGYKYNMTDIAAGIGLAQLEKLKTGNMIRSRLAEIYTGAFREMPEIETPVVLSDRKSAWHIYVIRLNLEELTADRNRVLAALQAENIGANVHFIPVHYHPYYRKRYGYKKEDFPVAHSTFNRVITLPLFPQMSVRDISDVISGVEKVIRYYQR